MCRRFRTSRANRTGLAVTVALLLVCGGSSTAQDSQDTRRVLALYWYAREYATNVQFEQGLLRALHSDPRSSPEYFSEYLENDRFPAEEHKRLLRDFLRAKYARVRIDVIVAEAWEPFQFLLADRSLFPNVPIVYNVVGSPDANADYPTDVFGVFSTGTYAKTIATVRAIHPETEEVLIVNSMPDNGGKNLERLIRQELAPFERALRLTYLTDLPTDVLVRQISHAPERSVVLYVRHSEESIGRVLDPIQAVSLFARYSKVPIYGVSSSLLGYGIVGGYLRDTEAIGAQSGELALRILAGTRPEDLPAASAAVLTPMFDWREMQRWGIDPSRLPPDADIRFKAPTAWDTYRWYIVGAVAFAAFQTLMIATLVVERSRRRQAQKRYALATAAGGVGVWDWNLETNEMYVDPFLKGTLGYEDHELRNRLEDWSRLVHPDDASLVKERAQEVIDGKSATCEVEHRMLHRDGSTRWFLARGSVVQRNGRALRVTGTNTDITARKISELALNETQAELARVSGLTALGEFAGSIAHEVRQPLTTIVMNAKACLHWLSEATPDLSEIRAALVDVVDAGKRADDLIHRNRELFRQHSVQKEPLDINGVIREVAVLAGDRLQAGQVVLSTSPAFDLPFIMGDRIELQQVLLNLIVNAIDATEEVDPQLRRIEISSSLSSPSTVKVSVSDNGIGLTGVDMQRMFSLSYTTKANGTGIGLSLSRSIIAAHGGRLWAEQNPERGATFSFALPIHSTVAATDTTRTGPLEAV